MARTLPAVLIALFVAAACGGAAPSPPTPSATVATSAPAETVEQRLARLYDAAKAEGKVAAYWTLNVQFANPLIARFEARFPGLKIDHTRASSDTLGRRLLTEKKAGQDLADVIEMEAFDLKFLIDQGYTQPYRVAAWEDFPEGAKERGGAWIADRINNDYPGINTTKVKAGEIKTWKDFCEKRYEGRVAVERDQVAVYSALRKIFGDAEAKALLTCLAANKPLLRTGNTEMANLLAAGEYWATFSTHAPALTPLKYEQKAPVDLVRTEPVITYLQTAALANKPPHPNAARLFLEWITSPEGQQALADIGQTPASTRSKTKYPELTSTGKLFFITPDLAADAERDAEFWRTTLGVK